MKLPPTDSRTPAWPPLGSVKLFLRRVTALRHSWCLSSRRTPKTHVGVGGLALRPTMPSAVLSGWTHPASPGVGRSLACCPSAAGFRRHRVIRSLLPSFSCFRAPSAESHAPRAAHMRHGPAVLGSGAPLRQSAATQEARETGPKIARSLMLPRTRARLHRPVICRASGLTITLVHLGFFCVGWQQSCLRPPGTEVRWFRCKFLGGCEISECILS